MMVASMIIPMEIASPPRDIRFAPNPMVFMTTKVTNKERGNAMSTTTLPRKLLRSR